MRTSCSLLEQNVSIRTYRSLNELRRHQNENHGIPLPRCDRHATNTSPPHTHTSPLFDDCTRSRQSTEKKRQAIASTKASRPEAAKTTRNRPLLPVPTLDKTLIKSSSSSPAVTVRNYPAAAAAVANSPEAHVMRVSHGMVDSRYGHQEGSTMDMSGHNQYPSYLDLSNVNYTHQPPPTQIILNTHPHHYIPTLDYDSQAPTGYYLERYVQESEVYDPRMAIPAQHGHHHAQVSYGYSNSNSTTWDSQPEDPWVPNQSAAGTQVPKVCPGPRSSSQSAIIGGGEGSILCHFTEAYHVTEFHIAAFFLLEHSNYQATTTWLDIYFDHVIINTILALVESVSLSHQRLPTTPLSWLHSVLFADSPTKGPAAWPSEVDAAGCPIGASSIDAIMPIMKNLIRLCLCLPMTLIIRIATPGSTIRLSLRAHTNRYFLFRPFLVAKSCPARSHKLDNRLGTSISDKVLLCTVAPISDFRFRFVRRWTSSNYVFRLCRHVIADCTVASTCHFDTTHLAVSRSSYSSCTRVVTRSSEIKLLYID
jgi:hypothetical protein